MRSIVGNDARRQMRLRQRHAEPIVPAGAPTLDKMIPFVDTQKAPSPPLILNPVRPSLFPRRKTSAEENSDNKPHSSPPKRKC